jgi:signal transduction histidine kinase
VLGNLLGNALKFTERGGRVELEAAVIGGMALIRVRDTGAGIASDRLPHVFDRFWQGGNSDSRGVGLGLAIAKAIVEAHGGTIGVESVVGQGSTFTLKLPLHNEARARETTSSRAALRIPSLVE